MAATTTEISANKNYYTVSDLLPDFCMSCGRLPDGTRMLTLFFKNGVKAYITKGYRPTFVRADSLQVPGTLGANLDKHVRVLFSL